MEKACEVHKILEGIFANFLGILNGPSHLIYLNETYSLFYARADHKFSIRLFFKAGYPVGYLSRYQLSVLMC